MLIFRKVIISVAGILIVSFFVQLCVNAQDIKKNIEYPTLILPEIPSDLKNPCERANYLVLHYWDNSDFTKITSDLLAHQLEQEIVNFLDILPHTSGDSIIYLGFTNLLTKASSGKLSFKTINELCEKYLAESSSPMVSDGYFLLFLKALRTIDVLSEVQKARVSDMIEMLDKNKPGDYATDFKFINVDGVEHTLQDIINQHNSELLLIFYDPDCSHCDEVISRLKNSNEIEREFAKEDIVVLAVYAGENERLWRQKAGELPDNWIVGINLHEIEDSDLYYFPSMPTIYLLNSEGKILKRNIEL